MKECEECGKKLGILKGYQHPTLGKKHLLCSPCFDKVSESVENWQKFVLSKTLDTNSIVKYANRHKLDIEMIQKIVSHIKIGSGSET